MAWIKEEKLYPLIVLLLIWIMAARVPLDTDMWWHLRAGEETVSNHEVYRVDDFSFTRAGTEWINHSWLSQVLMFGLFRLGGFPALSVWVAACAVASLFFVYLQMRGHPLLRGAVLLLAAVTASVVWSPRPQIFSLLLLALVTWIVFKYRENGNYKVLLSLPPIFALWGNLHGGYVLGLIYLGAYLAGDVLDQVLGHPNPGRLIARSTWTLGGFTFLGGLAVLINPFGFDMWRIPFNTVGVETLQDLINEWASPDFHQLFQQPMLWMLLGLLAVLALSSKKETGKNLIPILAFSYAALTARRNFGPFAIVAAPVLSSQLNVVLSGWFGSIKDKSALIRNLTNQAENNKRDFNPMARNVINLILVSLLVFTAGYKTYRVTQQDVLKKYESEMFPMKAIAWMQDTHLEGNLFNDYNWGGYLIYQLPESKVFVDGRTDLYGDEILTDYVSIINAGTMWETILNAYPVEEMLLQRDSNLAYAAKLRGWSILYQDENSVILQRR